MNDDKDAVVGRVLRERRSARERLAVLQTECQHFARDFSLIGASLAASPEYVVFERQLVDVKYYTPAGSIRLYKREDFDVDKIIKLTSEIRDTLAYIADLSQQAKNLGID